MRAYSPILPEVAAAAPIPPRGGCNLEVLRKASRRLSLLYEAALLATGITPTQHMILVEIARSDPSQPLAVGELAKKLVMDRTTLGRDLQPLVRDGLASVMNARHDRRSRHIKLTAEGKGILAQAYSGWRTAQADFEARFGEAQASELRTELLRIASDESISEMADRLKANANHEPSAKRPGVNRKGISK